MMVRPIVLLVSAVAVAFVLSGCSSTTSPNRVGSPTSFNLASVGSRFVYRAWNADSNGITTIESANSYLQTDSVVESGVRYQGKNNTTHIEMHVTGRDTTSTPLYVARESNGNLSWYWGTWWEEIPIASQQPLTFVGYDTSQSGSIFKVQQDYKNLGNEDLSLAAHTFHATKISVTYHFWRDDVEEESSGYTDTYWFASETGWFVKWYEAPYRTKSGILNTASQLTLDGYTLK